MSDAVKSRTLKSSDSNNEVLKESQLRKRTLDDDIRTEFVDYHKHQTQMLVQEKLDVVYERWEMANYFNGIAGRDRPSFETWALNKPVVRIKPDGTNILNRANAKVFGLVAESLEFAVEGHNVTFVCQDGWLKIKTASKRQ